jgi:hypothetical protein
MAKGSAAPRHSDSVEFVFLALAAALFAGESQDRAAIDKVIAALNTPELRPLLFTRDVDIAVDLDRLIDLHQPTTFPPVIGREETWSIMTVPRIVSGPIRFTAPDAAEVDGASTIERPTTLLPRVPVQFTMKKQGGEWRIAAVRTRRMQK